MRSNLTSLFSERDIHSETIRLKGKIAQEIDGWDENKVLNVIEADAVVDFSTRYKLTPPEIHFNKVKDDKQKGEGRSNTQFVGRIGGNISGPAGSIKVVALTIPVSGEVNLLNIGPSEYYPRYPYTEFGESEITIFVQVNRENKDQARKQIKTEINKLQNSIEFLAADFEKWNNEIPSIVVSRIRHRKKQIQESNEFHDSLGISNLDEK